MHYKNNYKKGFTAIELIIVLVAILLIGSLLAMAFSATIRGSFTTAPPTIPAGSGSTFVYTVTQTWVATTKPKAGRKISFRVAPGGTVITVSPTTGISNGLGEITVTVTPHADYRGGGNIWAKDDKSGEEDSPVHFTVN